MIGIIATLSFAIGLGVGAILFRQFQSDSVKIAQLEKKLLALQLENDTYKENVHSHFNTTAQLMTKLTDNYREVYRQLASGAQALCPESISSQLSLSSQSYDVLSEPSKNESISTTDSDEAPTNDSETDGLDADTSNNTSTNQKTSAKPDEEESLFPPRDYSPKSDPNQKGSLAEDYGLTKSSSEPKQ